MAAAIVFDNVSKHYRGAREYRALRDDIVSTVGRTLGIARTPRPTVQALDGVSFEVAEGESVAVIGANGAGKTTALKIATRVAFPSAGTVRVRGRVGALIEVGTGMHPELSGRENVQLYGRILGLSRQDVSTRFDEIVDFAGVAEAIDRPVKQYSSGMQLRLGFSIAAHLEPDVLLVDEAIAVGDVGFQQRCVERMGRLVREGRTLILVSHDMPSVEATCTRGIRLHEGRIADDGPIREIVAGYLGTFHEHQMRSDGLATDDAAPISITSVELLRADGGAADRVPAGQPLTIRVHYSAGAELREPLFTIGLSDPRLGCFATASMLRDGAAPERISGHGHIDCTFHDLPLHPRSYEIWGAVRDAGGHAMLLEWQRLRLFEVVADTALPAGRAALSVQNTGAPVRIPYHWTFPEEQGT